MSNEEHRSNLHLHYNVTYPSPTIRTDLQVASSPVDSSIPTSQPLSFFEDDPARLLYPHNPEIHKPLTLQTILNKKLRWVTLGGQYDWTAKVYPSNRPPMFPEDIGSLLRAAFPETEAQAAILNLYSPGDTLSPHRDVSEECDVGLISVSFGCDGLFLISHDDGDGCEVIRLRSGDAVYMNGPSRFAWHGVPKIIPQSCPDWLADWPCVDNNSNMSQFPAWKGWLSGKRVNLNVRQMRSPNLHDAADPGR